LIKAKAPPQSSPLGLVSYSHHQSFTLVTAGHFIHSVLLLCKSFGVGLGDEGVKIGVASFGEIKERRKGGFLFTLAKRRRKKMKFFYAENESVAARVFLSCVLFQQSSTEESQHFSLSGRRTIGINFKGYSGGREESLTFRLQPRRGCRLQT